MEPRSRNRKARSLANASNAYCGLNIERAVSVIPTREVASPWHVHSQRNSPFARHTFRFLVLVFNRTGSRPHLLPLRRIGHFQKPLTSRPFIATEDCRRPIFRPMPPHRRHPGNEVPTYASQKEPNYEHHTGNDSVPLLLLLPCADLSDEAANGCGVV